MRRLSLMIAVASLVSLTACTPGSLIPNLPGPQPSAGLTSPQNAVGSALQVRSDVMDAQAKTWSPDAQLIGIQGSAINGDGVNFAAGSKWVYTYRSAAKQATAVFTATSTGVQGPTVGADAAQTGVLSTSLAFDSDQAVQKYKSSIKDKTLDRFNLSLVIANGIPTWQILAIDSLGTGQGGGSVNASNGAVTVA